MIHSPHLDRVVNPALDYEKNNGNLSTCLSELYRIVYPNEATFTGLFRTTGIDTLQQQLQEHAGLKAKDQEMEMNVTRSFL